MAEMRCKASVPSVVQACTRSWLKKNKGLFIAASLDDESVASSRNPYIGKLSEFPTTAFAQDRLSIHRGQWHEHVGASLGRHPQKLVLEIGCSNGAFLAGIAKDHPEFAFFGMDWKYKLVYKGCKKSQSLGNKNMVFLRSRAQDILKIFGAGELDEAWIFFPDPWPKAAQQKHRLFQEPFLKDLAQVLKPGGRLYVKTDHPGYFEWMLAIMGEALPAVPDEGSGEADAIGAYRGKRERQFLHRSYANKDLPPTSEHVRSQYELEAKCADYWTAVESQAVLKGALFAERRTLFENLFLKDKLPIHYLQLRRKG